MKIEGTWDTHPEYHYKNLDQRRLNSLLGNARDRARKKNLPFTITRDDIKIPTHCPILGIELKQGFDSGRANSPSIDQIIVDGGYTPKNIQIISYLANQMKSNGTLEQCVALGNWARKQLDTGRLTELDKEQIAVYNNGGNASDHAW